MKFLVLVCALLSVFAYAQEDKINMNDPNINLYQGEMAASVVDTTGTHEDTIRKNYNIPVAKSCPLCALQGGIDLVDENGIGVKTSDGSSVKTGNPNGTIGQ